MRPLRSLALVLLALAVAPVLAFAAYQVWAVSESEAMLARVRDEQLGTLLFAVNQHAWETADGWAERLERIAADGALAGVDGGLPPAPPPAPVPAGLDGGSRAAFSSFMTLTDFLHANPAVETVVVLDAAGDRHFATTDDGGPEVDLTPLLASGRVARLQQRRATGYRQLEPVPLPEGMLGLVFATGRGAPEPQAFAFVVQPDQFIARVVVPKLQELAQGGLSLAVLRGDSVVASTGPTAAAELGPSRALWLLPEHRVAVVPSDGGAEAVLRARSRQGLWLIGAVAAVLLGGAAFAFQAVRREVAVAQREVQLARMRQDFVQNVSHELRTPLALIRMYAETLAAGRVPEARRAGYYRTLVAESERLSRLVGNVLHFARFERGAAPLARRPVDLAALAAETAERYRPVLEQAGLALAVDAAPTPPVLGDADALAESVLNLLDNASKYGAGTVTLRTGADAAAAFVEVEDEGAGLAAADRERVFEAFERVQPESPDGLVHTAKGTGLGLALVRRIARGLGGDVRALDPTGPAGARFRLSLPLAAPPAHA